MPYVRRTPDGQIESLHRQGGDGLEYLPEGHDEVTQFVGQSPTGSGDFSRLDADFVRVIEDVIDTLISKNIFNITDLPSEAQAKLFARKSFRERAGKNALKLFSDDHHGSLIDNSRLTDLGDL